MENDIVLPGGARVPAAPGRYCIVPPPDLNELRERRFLIEYDFPNLVVNEMATLGGSVAEKLAAHGQVFAWTMKHPDAGGHIGLDRTGYQFNRPSASRQRSRRHQLIPDISYIDHRTWDRLSDEEKMMAYYPCIPAVVIELMSATDKFEKLQEKVSRFINSGTKEGVVVDTRGERVWIFNRGYQPYTAPLDIIEFKYWPGFELDCVALLDARKRAGFK